jgi:AmiR/NasT family two-component response regulator
MSQELGRIASSAVVVIHDEIPDAEEYVMILKEAGLGRLELAAAADAQREPSTYVTADAVIILCNALNASVERILVGIREGDPDALVVIIVAVRGLRLDDLRRVGTRGATAVVVLGAPTRLFYRQVAAIIGRTRRKRKSVRPK